MSEASSNTVSEPLPRRVWLDATTLNELQDEIGATELDQMLISFEAEMSRRVSALLAFDGPGSPADIARGAHALKGMSLSIGAFALGDAAHALEQASMNARVAAIDALRADLNQCARITAVAVRAWLSGDEIDA